ncbi:hypothetical protein [Streptomyces sp. NPDC057494]|uniref:hypothetical protein n=1 Tax=Streptomyces sp. NPDC057494 TaxID=3346148 RepID=UPI003685CA82
MFAGLVERVEQVLDHAVVDDQREPRARLCPAGLEGRQAEGGRQIQDHRAVLGH